jgi:hypothetical protein
MQMFLLYQTGRRVEAVLLAAGGGRMRLAARDAGDTIELSLLFGQWVSETGIPVEIESLIPIPEIEFTGFCSAVRPLASAAGRTLWTV